MMLITSLAAALATAAGVILGVSAIEFAETRTAAPVKTGYAPVNGLKLYYEIHGAGAPLILLHGGVGASEQAHGRTADSNRPLSLEAMADDIAGLIRYLGMERADVMGYSPGGAVALRTAIQHPGAVRKLVLVSTACRRDGWYPEILAGMAQMGPAAAGPFLDGPAPGAR